MDITSQKERLSQELKFLKESFEAEVISKDEFDKGKERIERKLNELDYVHGNDIENKVPLSEEKSEVFEKPNEEKKSSEVFPNGSDENGKEIPILVESKKEARQEPVKEEEKSHLSKKESENQPEESEEKEGNEKSSGGFWKFTAIALIILVFALGIFYFMDRMSVQQQESEKQPVFACYADSECLMDGMTGVCKNPATKDAKCEFTPVKLTKVTVLTDKDLCINCDTSRVLGILENWVGPINATEIMHASVHGKEFAQKYNAKMLPLYVIEGSAEEKSSFEKYKSSFSKVGDDYVLSERAAAATIYLEREEIPEKIDLFVKQGDSSSAKMEQNTAEFVSAFSDARFEKHLSTDALSKELGLNTFPVILVNNNVKLSGVNSAEVIKQGYCKLNDDDNCDAELSSGFR